VADFSQLQVGDIVRLNTKVDEELDVFVGDIKKFSALPGASGKDYAVRVTQIIREEQ
jgi:flagellar motor switch protein FliM